MMICVPPEAPITRRRLPLWASVIITGAMEEKGRAPGWMCWLGEGGKPNEFTAPAMEKSSISLLKMMPVREPTIPEPNLCKQELVMNREKRQMDLIIFTNQ